MNRTHLQIIGGVLILLIVPNLILTLLGFWGEYNFQVWGTHLLLLLLVYLTDKHI